MRINARTLLKFTTDELWDMLAGDFVLIFDDGELEVNARTTIYSSYAWEFHRLYPATPLLKKHHVVSVLGGKRLSSGSHLELLGNAMWSTHDCYAEDGENGLALRDTLSEMVYRLTNTMYNELSYRCEEFVAGLDVLDFLEVIEHPKVVAAMEKLRPTQDSIAETNRAILNVLMSPTDIPNNALSLAARSKLVNDNQVLQCVGPRGYVTDIDSNQFRYPIMRGYFSGMRLFYDSFIESRSAAKALDFAKSPLQDAEYFSRRLQLMTQVVQRLHFEDCGTVDYTPWTVRGPTKEGDELEVDLDDPAMEGKYYLDDEGRYRAIDAHSGDLSILEGMYYMEEPGPGEPRPKPVMIRKGDTHLVGRTLKLRTALHCAHKDPNGICHVCFGALSYSVPANTNIGQMCCTSLAQKSSQSVMSVKHLDGSASVENIRVHGADRKFLKESADGATYLISDWLRDKKVRLVIPADYAKNISDVNDVKKVEDLDIYRVTELQTIGFEVEYDDRRVDLVELQVAIGRRLGSMTYELLNYIKATGWGVDEKGNYTIDLAGWDWNKSAITLPSKHINMSDHSKEIANMLESNMSELRKRKDTSPDAFLVHLSDLVNSKLNVNVAVLAVVVYGSMIVSAEGRDYRLPKPWTERSLGVMDDTMPNRSLSAVMAYEGHYDALVDPRSYVFTDRMDHPFDALLMPVEVQAAIR